MKLFLKNFYRDHRGLVLVFLILFIPLVTAAVVNGVSVAVYNANHTFSYGEIPAFAAEELRTPPLSVVGQTEENGQVLVLLSDGESAADYYALSFDIVEDGYRYVRKHHVYHPDGMDAGYIMDFRNGYLFWAADTDCAEIRCTLDGVLYHINVGELPFFYRFEGIPETVEFLEAPVPEFSIAEPVSLTASAPDDADFVFLFYQQETPISTPDNPGIRIPHVNLSPELDAVINNDIDILFYDRLAEMEDWIYGVDYRYAHNGSVLSLFIFSHEGAGHNGSTLYSVNVDLETMSVLTLPQALRRYGYDYTEVMNRVHNQSSTVPTEAQMRTGVENEIALYDFRGNQFFINEENEICLVGNAYCFWLYDDYTESTPCADTVRYGMLWNLSDDSCIAYP